LFLDWRGDPVPKWLQGDLGALAKVGSVLGARQSETRRDGRFCTSSDAKNLARIRIRAVLLCLVLA
jgi:hypothetical protein